MRNINERFCTERYDENGLLTDFKVNCPDDFNFAYDVVDDIAVNDPDRLAMLWCNPEGEEHAFTFADMKHWSDKTANFLRAQGIGKGDMVLVILRRNYQFWFTALALQKLGAVLVPATFMLREQDLAYRLNGASIKAVICTNVGDIAEIVDHVVYMCPSVHTRILVNAAGGGTTPRRPDGSFEFPATGQPYGAALSGPDGVCALGCVRKGWVDFNTNVRVSSAAFERVPGKVTDPMLMYFSSGTSGEPKMVLHNGYYAAAHIVTAKHWHNTVADGGLHFTISDTGWGKAVWGKFYGQWFMESAVLTYDFDRFNAKEILSLIGRYHVTTFCCPPTMYRIIMTTANVDEYDLSSLVYCTTAGEPLNPDLFTFWREHTGLTIFEGFGQTETPLTVGNLTGSTPRIGSMGKPVPQFDTHILREDGTECEPGETGEICINIEHGAPGIMMEYYCNPEKTAAAMHDGWYHTGDTAWADKEGYFWYEGRNDDLIKSSGYRISPFEIESVLLEHGAVKECAVTGVPDPLRGQAVKATVVLMDGFEGSDELTKALQTWVKHNTAPYKFPRIIEYVNELPRTISGKIRHVEIRSTDAQKKVESHEGLDETDALVPDHEVNKLEERGER
ncbi:MAG: AMP-binding protein [Coriobacteriia bacterium]|nr:AMP-binding protein [Coriobacteriia bacterium]MBS5477461.1 AMP-binding protein [Coriobacteriia bacterium]